MNTESLSIQIHAAIEKRGGYTLDNFCLLLYDGNPWHDIGEMQKLSERGMTRGNLRSATFRNLDTSFRKLYRIPEVPTDEEKTESELHGPKSDMFLDQTPREFFTIVDDITVKCGFTLDEIAELITGEDYDAREANLTVLPIYIRLREFGYSPGDLSADRDA